MTPFDAWILGMVEGITEYLPVSSTGHLILTSWLLGLDRTPEQRQAVHDFEIIIQGGAILAVLGLYRARIAQMVRGTVTRAGVRGLGPADEMRAGWTIARNVMVAFVPAAAVGLLAKDAINEHLFNPGAVAAALAVGGAVMLAIAPWQARRLAADRAQAGDEAGAAGSAGGASQPAGASVMRDRAGAALARMTAVQAAMVGTLQCLALWPGTSRSFVTIVGGLLVGLGAVAAAEFSFLLGLVTLTAASGYSVLKVVKADGGAQFVAALGGWLPIACGIAVAWASAALSIDLLVRYLQRHTLALFGWWRLLVAALVGVFAWRYGLTLPA
jgi:undecaprenyl-diphosphatase